MKPAMEKLEHFLELGGTKKDITLLVISGIALIVSIFDLVPLPFDASWAAIILCGIPIILEAVIGLVTAFDIKADVLVSLALIASVCIGEDFAAAVLDCRDTGRLADLIAQNITLRHQDRQRVLEELGEARLTDMILNLREPYKTPCRLMLLEQHTAAEAAALCGRPQKTVEAQVYRAKKMLAETIRQERRSEDGMVSG